MQKRTSPIKFAHLAEKSANGSISNLSTKIRAGGGLAVCRAAGADFRAPAAVGSRRRGGPYHSQRIKGACIAFMRQCHRAREIEGASFTVECKRTLSGGTRGSSLRIIGKSEIEIEVEPSTLLVRAIELPFFQ